MERKEEDEKDRRKKGNENESVKRKMWNDERRGSKRRKVKRKWKKGECKAGGS